MGFLPIKTYDKKKKKEVTAGLYDSDTATFQKTVTAKHLMKIMQGYGIQETVIKSLEMIDCQFIEIKTPNGLYWSLFETWLAPKVTVKDFGNGLQRFLPLDMMIEKGKSLSVREEAKEVEKQGNRQTSFLESGYSGQSAVLKEESC